jgi:hypothetical protein
MLFMSTHPRTSRRETPPDATPRATSSEAVLSPVESSRVFFGAVDDNGDVLPLAAQLALKVMKDSLAGRRYYSGNAVNQRGL